jgi:cellulose synthase/poly-beta-1,6-N-acetylglucosamine synthase-like glycosyltransferase
MRVGEYAPGGTADRDRAHGENIAPAEAVPAGTAADSLRPEAQVLLSLGIGKPLIARAAALARRNGTSIEQELIANGWIAAGNYYAAIARALRLGFFDGIDSRQVTDGETLDAELLRPHSLRLNYLKQGVIAVVPEARRLDGLRDTMEANPDLRDRLAITTPAALRTAVWEAGARRRLADCVNALFERRPKLSARVVFWGNQGFYCGVFISMLCVLLTADHGMAILHAALSLSYLAVLMLRLAAMRLCRRQRPPRALPAASSPLPVYTVLVALYREAAVAAQLVAMLKRLDWPASLLDIKLVCEADDRETIEALKAQDLAPHFEIVEVPPGLPRTKPKALSYALAGARGEYLAVYDAEDRPHPGQLREACETFRTGPAELACLQAPLVIGNGGESWISAIFSLEYSALFRAFLPMLARYRLPMPLGGTSNHFKTAILKASDGWDPFNVTEDADLGMRLHRLGYRCGTVRRQTVEDAPTSMAVWTRQRTRWFKGWLQTWLVMMRDPAALVRDMGLPGFLVFQLMIGGMLISSLAHPLMLVFILQWAVLLAASPQDGMSLWQLALFWIDFANILGSYAIFLVLGYSAMTGYERKHLRSCRIMVPLYWLMVSFAAWRAAIQLKTNPFMWEKTPHQPARTS